MVWVEAWQGSTVDAASVHCDVGCGVSVGGKTIVTFEEASIGDNWFRTSVYVARAEFVCGFCTPVRTVNPAGSVILTATPSVLVLIISFRAPKVDTPKDSTDCVESGLVIAERISSLMLVFAGVAEAPLKRELNRMVILLETRVAMQEVEVRGSTGLRE